MRALLRSLYRRVVTFNSETRKVLEFASASCRNSEVCRVLDVGCGQGKYLRLLSGQGMDVIGVEANSEIVRANRAEGLHSLTVDAFSQTNDSYDVMLMSHVVEHLAPRELLDFMDRYLDRLRPGGHLVIATPLLSSNFYDDFDHIRPYQPIGIEMVFGCGTAQVQYYARNRLKLKDIWFRRSAWRSSYLRARYVRSPMTRVVQLADFLAALAFRLTGGLLGRTDGWVGLFRKIGPAAPEQAPSKS